jgi:dCTP deaminase
MTHALRRPGLTAAFTLPSDREGVLPNQHLEAAIAAGIIDAGDFKIQTSQIQPASLDLRLDEVAYRIRCCFLPSREPVAARL